MSFGEVGYGEAGYGEGPDAAASGDIVSGGLATETDSALAGAVVVGIVVSGGLATEADSALTGTVKVGIVVVGGQATETDVALAGSVSTATIIAGGFATETDSTFAGSVKVGYVIAGGLATETDSALAGTVDASDNMTVTGGFVTETDQALPGAVLVDGEVIIPEDVPVETDTELVEVPEVDQGDHEDAWHPTLTISAPPLVGMWNADDVAFVLDGSGTKVEKRRARLRDVVLVGDQDVTIVNGHRTLTADFQRMKPFSFGPGTLRIQGINPLLDDLSTYTWLEPWAKVFVVRVDDEDAVQAVDYRGRVQSWDVSGAELTLDLGGMFSGPASVQWRPKPLFRRREDVTYWLHAMFRKNQMPLDAGDPFGVTISSPPQGYHLNCALDVVAQAVKRDGTALTVWYDEEDKKFTQGAVDRETIHATIYADHGHTKLDVTRDFSTETNQVYASGYDEDGGKILFAVAPGLEQVDPIPDFPGDMVEGDEDADTTTGFGVSLLIFRLIVLGYLKRDDKEGGFDDDVAKAVADARVDAKLSDYDFAGWWGTSPVTDPLMETVDEDLWNWLWDSSATGFTMKEARIRPAYEDPRLGKYNFTGSGQLKGLNPDYDPSLIPVSETVDFTTSMRKGQMKRRARRYVETGPNWSGSLTTQHGFIAGEHNPGDAFTEADILSNRDIREGWNIWVPNFDGGTLFHVAGIDVSDDGFVTRFMVDTRARDTLTLDAVLDRQEQNRLSPSKAFWKRASGNYGKDAITGFLGEIGGKLGADWTLETGWNVGWVPVGDYGLIQRFRTRVRTYVVSGGQQLGSSINDGADGVEHQSRIFAQKTTRAWMAAREPDPTAAGAEDDYKAALDDYKDRGLLAAYGTDPEDPCGYGDGHKADGDDLSGNFFDDSGFPFRAPECRVWVAIYVPEDSVQLAGWMFRWQVDEGT